MTVLGCIADDFTGATDLAGLLARSGVRVRLHTGLPSVPPGDDPAAFEVIALKIRTAPVDEARAEALAAYAWLQAAGARRFFWKYCSTFDSTPDGNIGPVADALLDQIGAGATIHCPTFPENGRRVFMGNLFVHQQLLAQSPMKDHPLTPMRDSDLLRLLAPQAKGTVALADWTEVARGAGALRGRIDRLAAEGARHIIVDALDRDDLRVIATGCRDLSLICGGSAVAMALPELYLAEGTLSQTALPPVRAQPGPRAIVLSGSTSAMTNAQVAAFLATGVPAFALDPLRLASEGHAAVLDWLAQQDLTTAPLVYATTSPENVRHAQEKLGIARAGHLVEAALAAVAVRARDLGARRFVVAGGETSGAVTQALGVTQMEVGEEIAPGVPWCDCISAGHQIALTLKSGNFGQPGFFRDALSLLQSRAPGTSAPRCEAKV